MSDNSAIEWTDATWNPVTGCAQVSPGCDHCYALTLAERFRGTPGHYYEHGFDLQLRPDKLDQPLRWKKPRKVFVNSMSDLFHDQVPDEYIAKVFAVMAMAPQHTFQVLTKRHGRMRSLLNSDRFWRLVGDHGAGIALERVAGRYPSTGPMSLTPDSSAHGHWECARPLPNVWLGVSVENEQWANIRVPALLDTPAAVRWLSCEPLLGPITLAPEWLQADDDTCTCSETAGCREINWVVVGGESGRGARPMHPDWAHSLRDQCETAGVPFLFKQWGAHGPDGVRASKHATGRELDGRTWDEYPTAVPA